MSHKLTWVAALLANAQAWSRLRALFSLADGNSEARSCAIRSASPSSADYCSASCSRSIPLRSSYLVMERVKTRLSRPAPLQTEFDLPDQPGPSQHPAE